MKSFIIASCFVLLVLATAAQADSFGTGGNQFSIDFVPISGDASSANGTNISQYSSGHSSYKAFTDPDNDYRMGTYEITNSQWDKFTAGLGVLVTGFPSSAYNENAYYTGTNVPTNELSWYEATQFVNWLNTSTNHSPAYKFTGTQGTTGYTFAKWSHAEAAGGTNLYRHKDAFYFLPTEDEWVKAAYWNGTTLQQYATKPGDSLFQGNGSSGGWNYQFGGDPGPEGSYEGPWNVGGGNEELNGTYDMMGNVWEWMESPHNDPSYPTDSSSSRGVRSGSWGYDSSHLVASYRNSGGPVSEYYVKGFRVASVVPEPTTITLLLCGLASLLCCRRRK